MNIKICIILLAVTLFSCQKQFVDFEKDPNRPGQVPPDLVLTGVLSDLNIDRPWSNITRWNQFDACNYNYYGDQRYDWGGASLNYLTLTNIQKMEEEALRVGNPAANEYAALAKFFKAFFFYRMTCLVGDIPLSEALNINTQKNPKYDTQENVFKQILAWLEEANTDMASLIQKSGDKKVAGDFYYNNLSSWQRAANAFKLRVLIALSKKEGSGSIPVKTLFSEMLSNATKYPLFRSGADNLQYIYQSINKYPSNPDNLGFDATRYNMAATYLNNLVKLNDPRAFVVAEPATKRITVDKKSVTDITAYNGASSGEDLADMSSKMAKVDEAEYSVRSRQRYYANYNAEPGIIVGYTEMCFNIAEGIHRNWATGNAEDWYIKGIKSSISSYGIPVDAPGTFDKIYPYNTPSATTYKIPFDFNQYYAQADVKYKAASNAGLEQILLQKYLAFFQNSGWEAYFNYRRTGVPTFLTGTGTGNSGIIPQRFKYASSEQSTNKANWEAALKNQFGNATDDINAKMWLIK